MNNRNTAGKIQLAFTFLLIVFLALYICSLTVSQLMITWVQWSSAGITALILYLFMYGGYFYIEVSKNNDHFEIRFYNVFPFSRQFKMFQIPIATFIKYEISGAKYFRRRLFLYQMSASQMAKYPPVFVSAFSLKDEEALKNFFASLKK